MAAMPTDDQVKTGRETLRLRNTGPAEVVTEEVSPTGGQLLLHKTKIASTLNQSGNIFQINKFAKHRKILLSKNRLPAKMSCEV